MLHQIKRCSAPCTGLISLEDYGELVTEAEQFLRGKSRAVIGRLSQEMQAASDAMDFEQAARVRDRIRALSAISMENSVSADSVAEGDVFALHSDGGQACVQVFFYRAARTGAAAPISRAWTRPTPIPRSWPPSWASSMRTSRSRA